MSAAYEFAKVAVPVATGVAAISAYVVIRWKAFKMRSKYSRFRGLAGGDFGAISGDYGSGHHGGHGDHGGHHGDCGGHHGGGGGHP